MKKRRLIISPEEVSPEGILFSREHSHYLVNVLRLGADAEIHVLCGRNEYLVRLKDLENGKLRGESTVTRVLPEPESIPVILAFGCVKPGPFEEILRHGTELGVSRFVPIMTRRTTRRPAGLKTRWTTIVASACAQSGRVSVPEVEAPLSLDRFLTRDHGKTCKILLSPDRAAPPLIRMLTEQHLEHITILVGPEGGFDPSESDTAVAAEFRPAKLTHSVLRTETACITAVGLVACGSLLMGEESAVWGEGQWGKP